MSAPAPMDDETRTPTPEKPGIRVLVTGSRDGVDFALVAEVMCRLTTEYRVTALIHGSAHGVDQQCATFAAGYGMPTIACPAQWHQHGRKAGPIRNGEMLRDHAPDVVLAFPGGRGTADMVRQAERAGVRVVRAVDYASDASTTLLPARSGVPSSVVLAVDFSAIRIPVWKGSE